MRMRLEQAQLNAERAWALRGIRTKNLGCTGPFVTCVTNTPGLYWTETYRWNRDTGQISERTIADPESPLYDHMSYSDPSDRTDSADAGSSADAAGPAGQVIVEDAYPTDIIDESGQRTPVRCTSDRCFPSQVSLSTDDIIKAACGGDPFCMMAQSAD